MPFTNPWDETQPPDTQLAKLLGQDLRSLKGDIAERFAAFMSGTLANRPTPEAVFGNSQNGILYFATDQGIFYQWNGTTWNQVSGGSGGGGGGGSTGGTGRSFIDNTQPALVASNVFQNLNLVQVPANFISMNGTSIEVFTTLHQTDSINGAVTFQLLLNGVIICSIAGGLPTSFDEAIQAFITIMDASVPSSSRIMISANGYPAVQTSTGLTLTSASGVNLTGVLAFSSRFLVPVGTGHYVGGGLVVRVTF